MPAADREAGAGLDVDPDDPTDRADLDAHADADGYGGDLDGADEYGGGLDGADGYDGADGLDGTFGLPRWLPPATLVTVAAGLGVSGYLTYAHFTNPLILACPATSIVNCEKVTTSPESHLLGIPVAVLGLVFFAVMAVLVLPPVWRRPEPLVRWGRLAFAVTGIGMVIYLVYTELFTLDAICLWCTSVHVLTVILFALIVLGTTLLDAG